MPSTARNLRRVALAAAALGVAALVLAASAGLASSARASLSVHMPGPVPAEAPLGAVLATPCAPVSVTCGRSFTVTAAVGGQADEAPSATVECLRQQPDGSWSIEASASASLHATGAAGPYVSATVRLPAAGAWVLRALRGTDAASESPTSTEIRVSALPDHIVWNRDGNLTLPEKMAQRDDARQLIIATASSLRSHAGTMTVYEYRDGDWAALFSSACRFGRNALRDGTRRHRGDGTTPTGIWQMPGYVFGTHTAPPSGTRMPFRHITSHTWWSAEKGPHYNTWVTSSRHVDGEHLADAPVNYEFALSTGYNAKPNMSVYGRGSGIFFHVWKGPTTAGCVAVPRSVMLRVFRTLDPKVRRVFAIGTTAASGATSIYAY